MNYLTVYYNAEGKVLIELEGMGLELERPEAEQLFVDLGHVLQDMDIDNDWRNRSRNMEAQTKRLSNVHSARLQELR